MHSPGLREATQVFFEGCCPNPIFRGLEPDQTVVKSRSSSATCHHDFAATTTSSFFPNTQFTNHESIASLQESFVQFIKAYPKYSETAQVDQIRGREYVHLSESNHVCLDYIGVGLFSQSQSQCQYISTSPIASSSNPVSQRSDCPVFGITYKSVNLKSQLLHGGDGSELESAIKKRIMDFLKISQNDYSMVFTANRSSAFRLVAESYPFPI
ncbi:Pyridoxal phosphate (PLP)-dependent transferase superfamily protein [Forsythia ovata]|uniref:Pyridoxal phosphate (PLP)-dependent transferase superfamily protein n=1 Tax=Forsythia ovata TaxID=205694 RepID=A0ABD1WNJ8_9LAMI